MTSKTTVFSLPTSMKTIAFAHRCPITLCATLPECQTNIDRLFHNSLSIRIYTVLHPYLVAVLQLRSSTVSLRLMISERRTSCDLHSRHKRVTYVPLATNELGEYPTKSLVMLKNERVLIFPRSEKQRKKEMGQFHVCGLMRPGISGFIFCSLCR